MVSSLPSAVLLLLLAVHLPSASAQGLGTCPSGAQPLPTRLDPPSGTTGTDPRESSNYTISGAVLDQVDSIVLDGGLSVMRGTSLPGSIQFNILSATPPGGGMPVNATISLIPRNRNCLTTNFTVTLFATLEITFEGGSSVQPGSVLLAGARNCVPGECGDSSTTFDIMVANITLERLSTMNTTLKYAGRLPNFEDSLISGRLISQDVTVVTEFQAFRLRAFFTVNLFAPEPFTAAPSVGQRGTNVLIRGRDLLGLGHNLAVSRVRLSDTDADVITSSRTQLQVQARSGSAGTGGIRINTTDSFQGASYDGPYFYLENSWTQLVDGNITDIIPPAAQQGRSVLVCGNDLLGNGTSITAIEHGLNTLMQLQPSPSPSNLTLLGSECLEVRVLDAVQDTNETIVVITSNTGAVVASAANFQVAAIESVSPNRGQVGTVVTIRGRGLLSGYPTRMPEVYLSDVFATLVRWSSTEIVVTVGTPPVVPNVNVSSVVGVMGNVVIEVADPLDRNVVFNVSNDTGWQYEELGVIDDVEPPFGQFGTVITVDGSNLLAYGSRLTHAMIGGMNATILDGASNSIVQLVVPDASMDGFVDVILFSETGATVRGSEIFEYLQRGEISAALPSQGQEGTFVTIEGTDLFGHGENITSVMFGDIASTIDFSTSNDSTVNVRIQTSNNTANTAVPIVITADTSAIVASRGAIWTFLVQGQITSNQPQQGQVGTVIVITGTNLLGGGDSISEVFLDGVSGRISSNSSTSITIIMDDLQTQRANFFPGAIYIMSNTGAIVSGGNYTHRASGTIDSFSPARGRLGTIVTIQGSNVLGFGTNISAVSIAGVPSDVMSFNSTTLVIAAGMGARNQSGPIVVQVDTGATITSLNSFTFDAPAIVSSVTPTQGAEGTGVSVSGSGLIPDNVRLTSVTVGGVPVSRVVTASNQEVSIIVGPAPLNDSDRAMILINASDGSYVGNISFSFINLTISLNGLSQGQEGTEIEITLPNVPQFELDSNLRVTVDDFPASITALDAANRRVSVTVPRARRLGTFRADVAVEGVNGDIARLRDGFTYLAEGLICSVTPVVGQTGTNVTVEGENLIGGGTSLTSATVVGQSAVVLESSNTVVVLELQIQQGSSSYPVLGDIVLTADTGAVVRRLDTFSLIEPGNITQVSPPVGQNGTTVDIIGTNLLQGNLNVTSVTLAGVSAVIIGTPSDTLISVQASLSSATQALPVVITLSSGAMISSQSPVTFQYLPSGRIRTIVPNAGAVGTRVTISGSNLLQGGSTVRTVLLGGAPARLDGVPSNTSVVVVAGTGVAGLGDVVIVSDTGSTVSIEDRWNYEELGTITSISPDIGQQGLEVTIRGESLLGVAATRFSTCLLSGVPATVVPSNFDGTMVTCRAGANPFNISGPVELVTDTGVILNSGPNLTFSYYAAYIDRVSESSGNNGTEVTITGQNLFNSPNGSSRLARVLFGSVEAAIVSSLNSEITVRVGYSSVSTSNDDVRVESSSGSFLVLASAWNYSSPVTLLSIEPEDGFPGDGVVLYGDNLVPNGAQTARVIIGQTEAFNVQLINSSAIQFQAGVYQNSDVPERDLPIQVVYPSGETAFNSTVLFQYSTTFAMVTSISPRAGGGSARVRISGANLPNSTDSIQTVTLAGVRATVTSAEPDEIIVVAGVPPPSGATGQVLIETVDGELLGLAGEAWEYYPPITISDVTPITGQNGTIVSIDLSRISNIPSIIGVNLTDVPATDVTVSNGTLTVRAGQSTNTPLGDIIVSAAGEIEIVISRAWSYQAPVTVSNVSPPSGYFNTSVTIRGSGFQAGLGSVTMTTVYLAGMATTIISESDTMLQVRISEANSSATDLLGPIEILTNTGAYYSSEQELNFTYVGVQISDVSPQSGTRGTVVTLTGVGLLAGGTTIASATLAGVPANVMSSNSTSVSFAAGALASSSNLSSIEYELDTGAIVQEPMSWMYIEPGVITSVTPSAGGMGTIVSISGNNLFGGGNRVTSVMLNSRETTDILESFDGFVQVIAAASTGPLRPGNVQVISDTQAITESAGTVQFQYLDPGNVVSISPTQGQNGTIVTISGERFHNGEGVARVLIAGVEAVIRSIQGSSASSTIIVEAGRPTDSGQFDGPVLIQSSRNTTTTSAQNFTYVSEGVIFSVVPRQGRNDTLVSIEGENLFGGGSAVQNVSLAGEPAEIVNQTAATVLVRAPLGSTNASVLGDVLLVSDTNSHVRRVDGWTYVQLGTVSSITPSQGQYGTNVIIRGQNLLSGSNGIDTLRFDDVPLIVLSASDTTVTAVVGEPGDPVMFTSNSVTLTSDSGGVLYLEYSWNFLNQSTITSLDPPRGLSMDTVIINGTNLLGGGMRIMSVTVAGIAGIVMSSSDEEVMIMTGVNELGSMRTGNLVLESDTGALTEAVWVYEEECPVGMFGTAGNCAPCSSQCTRCVGPTEFNCTMCESFSIVLDENSSTRLCVEQCPGVSTENNICVDVCELNQYERIDTLQNVTFCSNCSSLCNPSLSCSGPGPSECTRCMFFRDVNQTCVENCSSNSFANGSGDCIPCHPQCSGGCHGRLDSECNACANLRVNANSLGIASSLFPNDVCREICPSLFFLEQSSSFCRPCDSSCSVNCTGPTPFDCYECKNVSELADGRIMCLDSCSPDQYRNGSNFCLSCSSLCLPGAGCSGPNPSDCTTCSLAHSPDLDCVRECRDSTYFIRSSTRTCERCDDACGTGGCTEAGPQNCISQGSLSAGPGTIALVVIVVLILIAVITILVIIVVVLFRRQGGKYKFPTRSGDEEHVRYTSGSAQVQAIPLTSIEKSRSQSNPMFREEDGMTACYSELQADEQLDDLYSDAENQEPLPEKNTAVSASQDVYTDMESLPTSPSKSAIEEFPASQEMYTDMEPILANQGPVPSRPPKPVEQTKKPPPIAPKESASDNVPPIPEKPQKAPPPPPDVEAGNELYTDMEGGITEVFVNPEAEAEEMYVDVETPEPEAAKYVPEEQSLDVDATYEDTESALAMMQDYRKSFGAGKSTPAHLPQGPDLPAKPGMSKTASAPALPSGPIPKKRPSSTATPLPPTPFQKSLSSTSFSPPISPASTLTRPGSVISNESIIPEEESLYDDVANLVTSTPTAKPQQQKKQQKQQKQKAKK